MAVLPRGGRPAPGWRTSRELGSFVLMGGLRGCSAQYELRLHLCGVSIHVSSSMSWLCGMTHVLRGAASRCTRAWEITLECGGGAASSVDRDREKQREQHQQQLWCHTHTCFIFCVCRNPTDRRGEPGANTRMDSKEMDLSPLTTNETSNELELKSKVYLRHTHVAVSSRDR